MFALQILVEVRRVEKESYRRFERACVRLMARYGGRLHSALELEGESDGTFFEAHVVTFPDEAAFDAYLVDPERAALRELREKGVVGATATRGELIVYE